MPKADAKQVVDNIRKAFGVSENAAEVLYWMLIGPGRHNDSPRHNDDWTECDESEFWRCLGTTSEGKPDPSAVKELDRIGLAKTRYVGKTRRSVKWSYWINYHFIVSRLVIGHGMDNRLFEEGGDE